MISLTTEQFNKFSSLIYQVLGISISANKKEMLQAKLNKLMFKYEVATVEQFYNLLTKERNTDCWREFIDEITIHKTDFFRENNHFEFLIKNQRWILEKNKRIMNNREIRVWSAGCSTGEEPYTLAITLKETLPPSIRIKILATDVSSGVLVKANLGSYSEKIKSEIQAGYLQKYFIKKSDSYEIVPDIKRLVTFRQFNLTSPFPFRNKFDIIFCRNVMIYFNNQTQQVLLDKFYQVLVPGGLLFIGHSESLINKKHRFGYIEPTIYQK
ncbi:MAG TPA: protein-glutamate O-methyltransferase CheR [Bacillota bacterium]|nr:protein-glutamate O-methyltransferase CheR [Bacillota bacterium]HOL09477.1 protein-glutamate O-methyltransferase CheR [Bacillota bacterium]HPO97698.1 protein-glutamate O-methyltransferase CheR [Bacillota bacterium]